MCISVCTIERILHRATWRDQGPTHVILIVQYVLYLHFMYLYGMILYTT